MKKILLTIAAFAGIIAVQMVLAVAFNWKIAETFSGLAVCILFYYLIFYRIGGKKKEEKA